jgi:hypothetical protein
MDAVLQQLCRAHGDPAGLFEPLCGTYAALDCNSAVGVSSRPSTPCRALLS